MTINDEDDGDDAPGCPRLLRLVGLLGLLMVPLVLVWWPGCRQYPPVTTAEGLSQMKLLYAACNTKDPKRLARVEAGVAKLDAEGKLSPAERVAFARVVDQAKAGDWERAEKAAFKFARTRWGHRSGHRRWDADNADRDESG